MSQLEKDLQHTYDKLSATERHKLSGSTILITGSAGFIGFYLTNFFHHFHADLSLKKIICLDNFMLGRPAWQEELSTDEHFVFKKFDIISDDVANIPEAA